jgi:hypothetical protein
MRSNNPNQYVKVCETCGQRHDSRLTCRVPEADEVKAER